MSADRIDSWLTFAREHRTVVLIAGGVAVSVLLVLARICRRQKGRSAALTFAASTVALVFSAEGMWEVATKALHLAQWQAGLLFAFAEILMLSEANQARKKIAEKRDPRRHLRAVWIIALVAGLAAASHADNLSGQVIRASMPLAVAWQWSSRIKDEQPDAIRQESSWVWTPRTIGIHLGLIKPGKQDLKKVDRDRRIDAITATAHRLHHGSPKLKGWRKAKLRRLALEADDVMVAEAQQRVARVNRIEALTSPDARSGESSDAERDLMDDLRQVVTQATTAIRADHARAFGVDQPAVSPVDQIRSNSLVQMRPEIADQIWSRAVDQHWSSGRTNGADQSRTNPERVDQPPTSAAVPAARPTSTQRTTARVDRVKPVSPAAEGEIPARIQTMVRDLKRKYRGEIPGRRTVMPVMGWTSHHEAQTAINLVRAERAAKTTEEG